MNKLEPANSWEVSYVISIKKPHINLGIRKNKLWALIGRERAKELQKWASEEFNHRWFLEHV